MDRSFRRTTLGGGAAGGGDDTLNASSLSLSMTMAGAAGGALGLSSSGVHTALRASMGAPGRRTAFAPPSSAKKQARISRTSLATGGAVDARRSSLVGRLPAALTGVAAGPRSDPRPIGSKAFVNDSIMELLTFLADCDYNQRISPKVLANPTGKDFSAIVTFMFRLVDPGFAISGKMEDDVQAVFRALRYPFPISKTSLTAVGSPQSWPALLGTLTWLAELLRYDGALRSQDEVAASASAAGEEAFFWSYVSNAYGAFLAGEDDAVAALDEDVAAAFGAKQGEIEAEVARLRASNAALEADIAATRAVESTLPSLKAGKADVTADIDKLKRTLTDVEGHMQALSARLEEYKSKMAGREAELDALMAEHAGVTRSVESQAIGPDDVTRMHAHKAEMRSACTATLADASRARTEVMGLEGAIKKALSEMHGHVSEYSGLCSKLQLLPLGAKHSHDIDFNLRLDETVLPSLSSPASAATSRALLRADMKEVIKPALRDLRARVAANVSDSERAHMALAERCTVLKDSKAEVAARVEQLSRALAAAEEALAHTRGACDAAVSSAESSVAQLREQMRAARTELAAVQVSGRELNMDLVRGLELQLTSTSMALDAQRRRAADVMAGMLLAVTRHKESVGDTLDALRTRVQSRRDTAMALPRLYAPSAPAANAYTLPVPPAPSAVKSAMTPALRSRGHGLMYQDGM